MKSLVICVLVSATVVFADPEHMPISVSAGGAAQAVNDLGHRVQGTVGQVIAMRTISADAVLHSGFWPSRNAAAPLSVERREPALPTEIEFHAAYPNPFNPSTRLSFSLPRAADVTLTLFDVTGRRVATLVNENFSAGTHSLTWTASRVSSGTYFARFETAGKSLTQKLHLIK